jgi:hypothetical protein
MNKMKIAILGSILMFLISFLIPSPSAAESELEGSWISLVQGQVLIQTKDEGEWTEASVNFPIAEGDRIVTERDGRVELNFKNDTYVRVGEISQLDIIALGSDQGKAFVHLNQLEGRIYVNHRPIAEETSSLYIDLPYGFLSSYVPSRFRVDLASSEARISVLEGSVEFKSDGRPIPLTQGKTLIVKEGGYAVVAQLYGKDEWDRWNEARDNELVQRRYVQKYLPPELEPYGYEMEGNGRWVYTSEYQYVWVPTVVVGWAPFQYGYWAWRRGIYCWVPREPWGWVPFHYGRWVHTHNHGWAWVPPFRHTAIWNPGAVAWNIAPTYVSWVPLAPGEIYYGNRYYGPQSVNINQVNINIQKNVYINARVKDAVVTVHRDSFFRRNPVRIHQVTNPFLNPVKVSGPPIEKPSFLDGKKAQPRPVKEYFDKVQTERRLSSKEWERENSSVEKGPKVIEQKRITESPEKKTISETARNRIERIEQPNRQTDPTQVNWAKKDSTPVPTREKVKSESKAPNQEGNKNRNIPIVPPVIVKTPNGKEPKYSQAVPEKNVSRDMNRDRSERIGQSNSNSKENLGQKNLIPLPPKDRAMVTSPNPVPQSPQRNASVNVNQSRSERTGQANALQGNVERNQSAFQVRDKTKVESSTPIQGGFTNKGMPTSPSKQVQSFSPGQGGSTFAARPSSSEVRPYSNPSSKGQVIQSSHGSVGGLLGSSPLKSFR